MSIKERVINFAVRNILNRNKSIFPSWANIKSTDEIRSSICENGVLWAGDGKLPHYDHIEQSGFYLSSITSYGADSAKRLKLLYHLVFPSFRKLPNLTRDSVSFNIQNAVKFFVGEEEDCEKLESVFINGILKITSKTSNLTIVREITPAPDQPALLEKYTVISEREQAVRVKSAGLADSTDFRVGVGGRVYRLKVELSEDVYKSEQENTELSFTASAQPYSFYAVYAGEHLSGALSFSAKQQMHAREEFLHSLSETLVLQTGDEILDREFAFCKIRAAESIFKTKGGLMHSPGGGNYYAAVWTNDQCEYAAPLFAYLGYPVGVEASLNCFKLYQPYISDNAPLVSSIIAEGDNFWNGVGDRGDSAMYAYGAARFALSSGSLDVVQMLISSIRAALAFTKSKINDDGVVESDTDELENRFESGKANLYVNCIAYDAFISAVCLEHQLGNIAAEQSYIQTAKKLRRAINRYFSAFYNGEESYCYCIEEKNLRSWLCMPLVVGIFERASATAKLLTSPKLLTNAGLRTKEGFKTFWDRSTLYALRGMFAAGECEKAYELLKRFSQSRLLGAHVPYPVEAYPEGNQAQLSAESALYLRVFTEGIFGYRPTGLKRFRLRPVLPEGMNKIELKRISAHGKLFDISLVKEENVCIITITGGIKYQAKVDLGQEVEIEFK